MQYYGAPIGPTAETVAVDAWELTPADDKPLLVLRTVLGQTTEMGDSQEEFIEVSWVRGNTTSGSGGVAAAAGKAISPSAPTSGFTFEALNTTGATSGTAVTVAHDFWSVRGGFDKVYLPEERPEVSQGQTLMCFRLGAAPADSITMGGDCRIAEAG